MPTFSFVIPVKPGGFVAALDSLRSLDAESCTFEIFLAEGFRPSRQRNEAVNQSLGEIIYFLDDDSIVKPDCLAICSTVMLDKNIAVAGGPSLTPAKDSPLQQIFGSALSSIFGAGAVRNRYRAVGQQRETTDRELILCNLAIRKTAFHSLGGFDERLYPNEENELLERLYVAGMKQMHIPEMYVERSQRKNLRQFIRQMFSYGRGRGEQTMISGSVSLLSFAPLFFILYLASLLFLPINYLVLFPLFLYIIMDVTFSVSAIIVSGTFSRVFLLFIFPLIHIVNGFGLFCGLLNGVRGVSVPGADSVTVKRVKTFEQILW